MSDCLIYAIDIQRKGGSLEAWAAKIELVPAECRDEVRTYLRTMVQRSRVAREAADRIAFEEADREAR